MWRILVGGQGSGGAQARQSELGVRFTGVQSVAATASLGQSALMEVGFLPMIESKVCSWQATILKGSLYGNCRGFQWASTWTKV